MIDALLAHRDRARALADPGGARPAARLVRRPDAPSAVQRGRRDDVRATDRGPHADRGRDSARVSRSPADTRASGRFAVGARLVERGRLRLLDPLGYLEFIGLLDGSRVTLDRFRRHPGGDDHPGNPVHDPPGEHRAPHHGPVHAHRQARQNQLVPIDVFAKSRPNVTVARTSRYGQKVVPCPVSRGVKADWR